MRDAPRMHSARGNFTLYPPNGWPKLAETRVPNGKPGGFTGPER